MNTREGYRIIMSLICLTLALALVICEIFASQAEFEWAGPHVLGGYTAYIFDRIDEIESPVLRFQVS